LTSRSAIICYSEKDLAAATEVAAAIELPCAIDVDLEEGRIRADFDLIHAAERALSADAAVVLLSPESMPAKWIRQRWEPVFDEQAREFGTRVALVMLRTCQFPPLFRRKNFFDFSRDRAGETRRLRRWLLAALRPLESTEAQPLPPSSGASPTLVEMLRERLADRAGAAMDVPREDALAFAAESHEDFECVSWIDCARRTRAGVLGDISAALGLRLPGSMEANHRALREFASKRRCLFVLEHLPPEDREFAALGGSASTIFVSSPKPPEPLSDAAVLNLFRAWVSKEPECLAALGDAHFHLANSYLYREKLELGWAAVALLKHRERIAEAYEMLGFLLPLAVAANDTLEAHRIGWEQSWILEQWGEQPRGAQLQLPNDAEQLFLEF
jgi:hypothetical protein